MNWTRKSLSLVVLVAPDGESVGRGIDASAKERFDFVHQFLKWVFIDDLRAKRVLSLADGALGVMTGAALAVSLIGAGARAGTWIVRQVRDQTGRPLAEQRGRGPLGLVRFVGSRVGGRAARDRRGDGLDRLRRRQPVHARAAPRPPPRNGHAPPLAHRRQGRTEKPAQRFRGPVPVPAEGASA